MYNTKQIWVGRRKGLFPYEWLDSVDKLNELQLPLK